MPEASFPVQELNVPSKVQPPRDETKLAIAAAGGGQKMT